jgi:uroporphyrinogen decarboxylase
VIMHVKCNLIVYTDAMSENQKWIRETLSHKYTANVPYHFDFTPPARKKLVKHYGTEDLEDLVASPIRWVGTNTKKPLYADPVRFGSRLEDEFGVAWVLSEHDRGVPIPCLREPDLSHYTFPDPTESYRVADLHRWNEDNNEYYRTNWIGDLWERASFMRGLEKLLLDISLNKKFVHELLRGLTDYILATMEIIAENNDFECFGLSDDYGTQKSLIMSPRDWNHFIKPHLKEIFTCAKKYNKHILLHSCGNLQEIIPDLIDIGLDILHPIQPEAMDIYALKTEFGKDITFQGGMRTQDLLPYGKVEEIKDEVKTLKQKMGQNGGYILEPGITVQGDVPLGNIVAMIEEARA